MKKLLLFILIIITGCTEHNDLAKLTIIKSIGITYDNNYTIYAQIISDINKDNEPTMKVISSSGKTISQSFKILENSLEKEIFLSHIDLLILDVNLTDNNYQNIINYFINNNDFRNDFYCVFSSNIENVLTKSKYDEIETFLKTKNIPLKNFDNTISEYLDNKTITLPKIEFNEDNITYNNYKYQGVKTNAKQNRS